MIPENFFNTRLLGLDIETTMQDGDHADPRIDRVLLISLANDREESIVLEPGDWLKELWKAMKQDSVTTIIQNVSFDLKFLWELGFDGYPSNVWDTMIVERVFTAGLQVPCGLDAIAWRRLNVVLNKEIRQEFLQHRRDFTEEQLDYSKKDAEVLIPIMKQQWVEAKEKDLLETCRLENDLAPVVAEMEYTGVGFDVEGWRELETLEHQQASEAYQQVMQELDLPVYQTSLFSNDLSGINLNSWQQVLVALQQQGIGVESTGEKVLKEYLKKHPDAPVLGTLLKYRKHTKRAGFAYDKDVHPITGRIHTGYFQMGTDTGRFSSSGPNLQNVPRDPRYRALFCAPPGWKMLRADYSQQEMRILAEASRDPNLIEVCMSADIHSENARRIFGTVDKELRQIAKNCGFAMAYGASPQKVADTAGVDLSVANRVVNYTRNEFQLVEQWARKIIHECHQTGYVCTLGGRRRHFYIQEDKFIDNQIRNSPIQGTGGDMVKRGMVYTAHRLTKEGLHGRMVLTVHDEIVAEAPDEEVPMTKQIIIEEMERAGRYYVKVVPIPIDEPAIAQGWSK